MCAVRVAVGGNNTLVDTPGGFHFDVGITSKQVFQACLWAGYEKVSPCVASAAGTVEQITCTSPVTVEVLLNLAPV